MFVAGALEPDADLPLMVLVATVGNTLGGMTSWLIGRVLPGVKPEHPRVAAALVRLRRYGPMALLASWVPIIGDPLCVAAGWLRIGWLTSLLYMAIGKGIRYVLLALIVGG